MDAGAVPAVVDAEVPVAAGDPARPLVAERLVLDLVPALLAGGGCSPTSPRA